MRTTHLPRHDENTPRRASFRLVPVLLLAGFTAVALLSGCGTAPGEGGRANAAPAEAEEAPPIPVEVATVERGDIYAVYSATGSLEAERDAQVVSKVEGQIIEILVEEGDRVAAGDVLARLDGDQLRLELARSRAALDKLEAEYARNRELHRKGLLAKEAYDTINYDVRANRAETELAELRLSYTEIRAPIAGVVSERLVKVGNTITANTVTFRITDLEPLISELFVPEREFNKLAPNQTAEIRVDALGARRFTGRIARISPVIDPETATFKVTVEANDPAGALKPGMFARINVVYDVHAGALQIPREALVQGVDDSAVFVVSQKDTVERRTIETGLTNGARVEVLGGVEEGDEVVVVGKAGLSDGARVSVINRELEPVTGVLVGDVAIR